MTAPAHSLSSLFLTFLKIGASAFGGFMALISVVQNEVVERRRWLRAEDMLDGVSLATLLPGPVAVNVVAYVGYRLRGGPGALVSAVAVILPAFLLIVALSAAYFSWGSVPAVSRVFQGFIPAVAAIILFAAWNMGSKAVKGMRELALMLAAAGLLLGVGGFWVTLAIIAGGAAAGLLGFRTGRAVPPAPGCRRRRRPVRASLLSVQAAPFAPLLLADPNLLWQLFITFAGMSLFLFGGGYVFIPLMQETVVDTRQWLTVQEFVDGIALGQVTPGPILISAAFIGYKLAGWFGALVATAGIFLPATLLMLGATHMLDRIRQSRWVNAALGGIRPVVVGMIAAAVFTIGRTATLHWASLLIFAVALVALTRLRLGVVWVIPGAGLAGLALF